MAIAVVALVFQGSFVGIPSVVIFVAVVQSAGMATGLVVELRRICDTPPAIELGRILVAVFFTVRTVT